MYAEVTLDPEGSQEQAVRDIAKRFPGGENLEEQIERGLAEGLREEGLDYAKDVKPWLGDEAVFFAADVREDDADAAAVIATEDEDATLEAFKKVGEGDARERAYEGTDYLLDDETAYGVVDGHAVIGTEGGLRAAVDASIEGGNTIGDSDRVRESFDRLPDDRLAAAYFDGRKLLSAAGPAGAVFGGLARAFQEPYVFGLSAESDAVVVDSTLPRSLTALALPLFLGSGTDAIGELPADSWFAVGQPELGRSLQAVLRLVSGAVAVGGQDELEEQLRAETGLDLNEDILAWMGDLGAFASGTSLAELRAGAVIETKEPATSRRTLTALGKLARREADPGTRVRRLSLPGGGDAGFSIESTELPEPVHVVQRGRRVAVGFGDDSAQQLLEPKETLGEDRDFEGAAERLGDGYAVGNYLELAPILELVENEGEGTDPDYQEAKPYIEPFSGLVAGTKKEGDVVLSRTRVELR